MAHTAALEFEDTDSEFDSDLSESSYFQSPPANQSVLFEVLPPNNFELEVNMATSSPQVFIDGSFVDLVDELAGYIDNVSKVEESKGVRAEIKPLLAANKKDEALKKIVTASVALNAAPEKEFTAAYNLLVYLVNQSPNVNMFLPKVCENLSRPITSSPLNGSGLVLSVLSTLFNLLKEDNEVRYNVFSAILSVVKKNGAFESIRPELKKLEGWFEKWETDEEDQRKLYVQVADAAEDAGEDEYVSRPHLDTPPC